MLSLRGRAAEAQRYVAPCVRTGNTMNLIFWKATFVAALILSAGCVAYMASLQSSFFSKFSLRELVERNKSHGLNCSAGGGGGGGSISSFGGKESHFQKGESLSCQMGGAAQFDEGEFLQALKQASRWIWRRVRRK